MLTHDKLGYANAATQIDEAVDMAETLGVRLGHAIAHLQDQSQILHGMGNRVLGSQPEPVCAANQIDPEPTLSRQIGQLHDLAHDISRYVQRLNSVL